jgi:hypothetical protein
MANLATLQPNVFSTENQPAKNGRKKGVPNRATVYKNILKLKTKIKTPDGGTKEVTLYEAMALGQAKSAMKGNTNAWREIQDSLHGKQPDKIEQDVNQKVIVEFVRYDGNSSNGDQDKG